jgi:hypothetical protein
MFIPDIKAGLVLFGCLMGLVLITIAIDLRAPKAEGEYSVKSIIDMCDKYGDWVTIEMEPLRPGTLTVRCQIPADAPELDGWR